MFYLRKSFKTYNKRLTKAGAGINNKNENVLM